MFFLENVSLHYYIFSASHTFFFNIFFLRKILIQTNKNNFTRLVLKFLSHDVILVERQNVGTQKQVGGPYKNPMFNISVQACAMREDKRWLAETGW